MADLGDSKDKEKDMESSSNFKGDTTGRIDSKLQLQKNNEFDKSKNHNDNLNSQLIRIELENDSQFFRWDKLKYLIFSFFVMLLLSIIKGSSYFNSIIGVKV